MDPALEEYTPEPTTIFKVYFENNNLFIKLNTDSTLSMVKSKENASEFLIEKCSPTSGLRYKLIKKEGNNTLEFITGMPKKGTPVKLLLGYGPQNFWLKYYLNNKSELEKVAFLDFFGMVYNHTVYGFDNYGDGRVIWWDNDTGAYIRDSTVKENQLFNVIYIDN